MEVNANYRQLLLCFGAFFSSGYGKRVLDSGDGDNDDVSSVPIVQTRFLLSLLLPHNYNTSITQVATTILF